MSDEWSSTGDYAFSGSPIACEVSSAYGAMSNTTGFYIVIFEGQYYSTSPQQASVVFGPCLHHVSGSVVIFPGDQRSPVAYGQGELLRDPCSLAGYFGSFPRQLLSFFYPFLSEGRLLDNVGAGMPAVARAVPANEGRGGRDNSDPTRIGIFYVAEFNKMPVGIVVPPVLLTGTGNVDGQLKFVPTLVTELAAVKDVGTAIPMLLAGTPVTRIAGVAGEGEQVSLIPTDLEVHRLVVFTGPI